MDHSKNSSTNLQSSLRAEQLIVLAKASEQVERHKEQLDYMKQFARSGYPFSQLEKNLLNSALKISFYYVQRPNRWLTSLYYREEGKNPDSFKVRLLQNMIDKVKMDVVNFCKETIELLDDYVLKNCDNDAETKVGFLKVKGGYYRELTSYSEGDIRKEYIEKGLQAYKEGIAISKAELSSLNCDRLSLMLNLAVYYYEVVNDPKEAIAIAKEAYEEGLRDFALNGQEDNTPALFLQLLRDNMTLWTEAEEEEI